MFCLPEFENVLSSFITHYYVNSTEVIKCIVHIVFINIFNFNKFVMRFNIIFSVISIII